MASIPGSHFVATAPGEAVRVVETSGGPLPPPVHGVFNLEVWTGNPADAPTHPAHGYQGLAILEDGGRRIDLISGAFAVTDPGNGHDTISAYGTEETINGGAASVTLNLFGNDDVANGSGNNTISVFGDHDTANGSDNDLIGVYGSHDLVNGGDGRDTIGVFGRHDTVNGGLGSEQIYVFGSHDRVIGGTGNDSVDLFGHRDDFTGGLGNETVNAFGSGDSISAGIGDASINVLGNANTVRGGIGEETINVLGNDNLIIPGAGISDIEITGKGDSVDAGNHAFISEAQITVGGGDFRFNDGSQTYFDTIVGFDQHAGDRIHLTTESVHDALAHSKQVNGGHDTLITLNDGSTILLKGVSHINSSFFT
jgi:Ca2+-binding RTX toxin-like protein